MVVGQHPDGLELLVAQQVGFVDDEDGGAAAFVAFGGEDGGGLGGEPEPDGRGPPKAATIARAGRGRRSWGWAGR